MRATAALSEHPLASHAVGEVAGHILEAMDGDPIDLLVVFFHGSHTGVIEDIESALRQLLAPKHVIGSAACGVISNDAEVEFRESLSVWAASGIDAEPFHIPPQELTPAGGWDPRWRHAIILADPFTSQLSGLLESAAVGAPELSVSGGLASAATGPGGNRLLLDGQILHDGAVGMALSGVEISTVVSQGCRPIGKPLTVTGTATSEGGAGNVITELASKPPLEVLQALAAEATEEDRELLAQGLHIGVVIDELQHEHDTGDFLIRSVLGADKASGAIAVGMELDIGTTVQFHVRDAQTASEDLRRALAGQVGQGALTFTCNGRGERLFGHSGHDAEMVHEETGSVASAGMFCAGEFGPVTKTNHIHGFTASLMLFH